MNKIYIHKGDSTIFGDVTKFLTFNLETELDLTNWAAKFILGSITKNIEDISAKSFQVILTAEETSRLLIGDAFGTVILTDNNGNVKTINNTIPFEITTKVIENEAETIYLKLPNSTDIQISLQVGNGIPTRLSQLINDVGYITKSAIPTKLSELENDVNYLKYALLTQEEYDILTVKNPGTLYLIPEAS